nr:isopenicillin N synthase family oxygenase [Polyangiaceae bacterium]
GETRTAESPIESLLCNLRAVGYGVLKDPHVNGLRMELHSTWRQFGALPQAEKDLYRTPSLQGYFTPYPGLHEVFEHKHARRDPALRLPPLLEKSVEAMYTQLEATALRVFRAIGEDLGTPMTAWEGLLDDSTFRMLHFDRLSVPPAEMPRLDANVLRTVQSHYPAHCDSALMTVAPKASLAALDLRRFDSLEWDRFEARMDNDDLLVFVGDTMARLTNNYYPALLHRPTVEPMLPSDLSRISTPFFLRARPDALLDASMCDLAKVGPLQKECETPIVVEAINDNIGGARENLPWKVSPYYLDGRSR